jgi:predicted AAA+ superfamily ATPase
MIIMTNDLYVRTLDLAGLLKKKSLFLFGPRGTGKSFWIRQTLGHVPDVLYVDLLDSDNFLRLSARPRDLESLHPSGKFGAKDRVVIDEIQKVPSLLDEVHRLIETRGCRFLMTGSSARKLRHGAVNLLAGRAWRAEFFPLVSQEIPDFDLERCLRFGSLPAVLKSDEPKEDLKAYVSTYLREEIMAEALVRKAAPFHRFLKVAALSNGELINYASIASDAAVPATSVQDHYEVLVDTLLGFRLEPWKASKKRKAIATAKFYFFDTGVWHALLGTQSLDRNSDLYGKSFEQWLGQELRAYLSYRRRDEELAFWRSTSGYEVDYLVGDQVAIEVKATQRVSDRDLRGLLAIQEENVFKKLILVSQDRTETHREGVRCLHWSTFLAELWGDELLV